MSKHDTKLPPEEKLLELESKIGYSFNNRTLLLSALSHSSYSNELKEMTLECNERLEFLGDSVLGLVVSAMLYRNSNKNEGLLTKAKSFLVNTGTLGELAQDIDLGEYVLLGHGEQNDLGQYKPSILANTMEALLGAMYLDGGLISVEKFLLPLYMPRISQMMETTIAGADYKSQLQEMLQAEKLPTPKYTVVSESGPDHRKLFTVSLAVKDVVLAQGEGYSKKQAEQNAAGNVVVKLVQKELDLSSLK